MFSGYQFAVNLTIFSRPDILSTRFYVALSNEYLTNRVSRLRRLTIKILADRDFHTGNPAPRVQRELKTLLWVYTECGQVRVIYGLRRGFQAARLAYHCMCREQGAGWVVMLFAGRARTYWRENRESAGSLHIVSI